MMIMMMILQAKVSQAYREREGERENKLPNDENALQAKTRDGIRQSNVGESERVWKEKKMRKKDESGQEAVRVERGGGIP